jgi:hypothetical protein
LKPHVNSNFNFSLNQNLRTLVRKTPKRLTAFRRAAGTFRLHKYTDCISAISARPNWPCRRLVRRGLAHDARTAVAGGLDAFPMGASHQAIAAVIKPS